MLLLTHRFPRGAPFGTLQFSWGRDVPTLYLVAENDASLPLAGMYELFERTPARRQMVILRRADHAHFMDDVEEMRPIAELCSGEQAHVFVRGLTLCHMDSILKQQEDAQRFLTEDVEAALAERGINVIAHKPDVGKLIEPA